MKKSASLVASVIVSAFMVGGGFAAAAKAQEKAEIRELFENDKVRVYESRLKPGVEGPSVERPFRVVRALTDGTIQRIYPDGKTETVQKRTREQLKVRRKMTQSPKSHNADHPALNYGFREQQI